MKEDSGISIRLHDLRHTVITKLAEAAVGDEVVMAKQVMPAEECSVAAHITHGAKRNALEAITKSPGVESKAENL